MKTGTIEENRVYQGDANAKGMMNRTKIESKGYCTN